MRRSSSLALLCTLAIAACRKEPSSSSSSSSSSTPSPSSASATAPLASLAPTSVEITPGPTLDPSVDASSAEAAPPSAPPPPPPVCIADRSAQAVHVWFETRIVPLADAPKLKLFKGYIRIPELKIDKEVFAESAQNCKSCRAKLQNTSLAYHCGGDMAGGDGTVTIKDGVIIIESVRTPTPPPTKKDIEYHALACGSKAIFHSTSPDPDKKPVTGCE